MSKYQQKDIIQIYYNEVLEEHHEMHKMIETIF